METIDRHASRLRPGAEAGIRVPDWVVFLCFCAVVTLQLLGPLSYQSATFDEPGNLVSGYLSLRFGNDRLVPQNLPLVKLLAAAPLLAGQDLALPPRRDAYDHEAQYRYAADFLYRFNHADSLLLSGRLAVLPLSVALGWGVFLWTKHLFGLVAAMVALGLYAFDPNVLAHSALVTTDIATACFMFWALYGWYHLMQAVTWPVVTLTGLALGLALISKFTALSLFPVFLVVGIFASIISRTPFHIQLGGCVHRSVRAIPGKMLVVCLLLAGMGMMAAGVIWASYRFTYQSAIFPVSTYPTPWEDNFPASPVLRPLLQAMTDAYLLPDAYLYGLSHQLRIGGRAQAYLLGAVQAGGWWYYFLVTLAVKTPVPLLLFLLLSIPASWSYWRKNGLAAVCLFVPMISYFVMISASGWNIGHRHLLPIEPFLFILAGALASWALRQTSSIRLGLAALVCWYVVSSVSVFPHYLAYFNEFAGGPDNGHRYLVDSNLDWGQDLKGLKRYMDDEGIKQVWLSYFGQASPEYYGIDYKYLPSHSIFHAKNVDRRAFQVAELLPLPGTVAISATLLHGGTLQTLYHLGPAYFDYYRHQTPVAKIGHSIFIYRVE
jgi:hypothetical protein